MYQGFGITINGSEGNEVEYFFVLEYILPLTQALIEDKCLLNSIQIIIIYRPTLFYKNSFYKKPRLRCTWKKETT